MSTTTGTRDHGAYGAPPAPLGRRVAAALVDGALTALCAAPLVAALLPAWLAAARAAAGTGAADPAGPAPVLLVAGAVLLLAWGTVQWWCHGTRGWTLGRRALGLRTVDVRSGRPVGLGRALVRSLVVAAGVLACGVGQLLVLLSPLFDATRRRGWHDRVADAVVVDVRGLAAARRVAAPVNARAAAPVVEGTAPAGGATDGVPDGAPRGEWSGASSSPARPSWPEAVPVRPAVPAPPVRGGAWPVVGGGVPHQASPEPGLSPDLDLSDRDALRLDPPGPDAPPEPLPEPPAPTRTRWTTLAAGRQLDAPDLLLPALGGPGLGPDLDTRQLPAVLPTQPFGVPATATPSDLVDRTPAPPALPAPSVPPALPVPEVDAIRADPGTRPAWTPPPTPEPGARVPDPLDLAVPWVPAERADAADTASTADTAGGSGTAGTAGAGDTVPPVLDAWWHRQPDPAPAPHPPAPPAAPAATPPITPLPAETFPLPGPGAPSDGASAWTVRLPDGSVLGLDTPLLVGRNPATVPGARPVAVADPGRSVSKTHLMLGVDEHGPWVVDRGSTNGTLVTLGDGQRIVCLADRRVRLTDGSLVAFGDLSLSVRVRA